MTVASRPTRMRVDLRALSFRRCESQKVGYPTYEQALDAAERAMALDKVLPGCHITPYACPDCGEWHNANRRIVQV